MESFGLAPQPEWLWKIEQDDAIGIIKLFSGKILHIVPKLLMKKKPMKEQNI
jgi:hypothetical protein